MAVLTCFVSLVSGLLSLRLSDIAYTLKWIVSYLYLRFHKYLKKGRLDFYDRNARREPEKVGFIAHPQEIQLESPYPDSHMLKADDKIYFYGVNSQSECLFVSISRLCNQRAESNVYLKMANGKAYQLECNSDFQQPTDDKKMFSCGGLQMYYLCPMRRWRIFFSGFLKETTNVAEEGKTVYVKFSFLWRASSDVYDNTSDMNDSVILESLAKERWNSIVPPLHKLYRILDFYVQGGVILGTVYIDDTLEGHEMYLFGQRMRCLGKTTESKEISFTHMLGYVHKNGIFIHVGDVSIRGVAKSIRFGSIVKPTAEIKAVEEVEILKSGSSSEGNVLEVKATIGKGHSYAFSGSSLLHISQSSSKEKIISIEQMKFYLDGERGTGFLIKGQYNSSLERKISDIAVPKTIPELLFPMVVTFTDDLCQVPEITGGKGSSLGKLTCLSEELRTFVVPRGMVVTTNSYKQFITKDIRTEIRNLENVLYGTVEGNVKEACKRVCNKIIAERISNDICDNIMKSLKKMFGEDYHLIKFAVRSSATGEDTEQMSAAGQMDTYLGVSGIANILLAVKKCWASQFGFIAVQYKRRYGQCLNTLMGVVIQEMIACDVAGVVFTCNPVTGNPTTIAIAANFGLGESVVSGSEEPDTIELSRSADDDLKLHRVIIGSKNHKIVSTDFGTHSEDIPEDERQQCCISEENALKLGQLAIKIEKHYRSRRDIEWGMLNNNIYIFQSRPVTSGTQETDFEIEHEFDGQLRVENEYFSVSNGAEVLPGAMSPLGIDAFFRAFYAVFPGDNEVNWQYHILPKYFIVGWMMMYNHAMFCVADIFREGDPKTMSNFQKANMIAFFGRLIDEEEVFEIAKMRHAEEKMSLCGMYYFVKSLLFSTRILKSYQKELANYRIPIEKYRTSKDLFNALLKSCCDIGGFIKIHWICSFASMIWNMMIVSTLSDEKGGIDGDVYSDFATLITSKSDIESADVPSSIQALAHHITKSIESPVFKAMKVEEALTWLFTTTTAAGVEFRKFIRKHGHRCLMEFDMLSVPWEDNPKTLVELLQSMVGNVTQDEAHKRNSSVIKLLSQLKIPIGLLSKLKLMYFVPMSQQAVQNRESSKSLLIKGIDAWRKGYRGLARLMVAEGRIPEEDLIFFMTIEEIQELLNTRSPKILAKAYHRQRLHPKMDKYMFSELIRGFPRPINDSLKDVVPEEGYFSMKGIPVSQGVCKGYVRVAITLEEAADLKQGEILLAYGTDIAWSPYFPILSGVATELGGLISHGAVVSREYGLPCVVALHGATRRFKTGDYVLLDGNKGILQKISEPSVNGEK